MVKVYTPGTPDRSRPGRLLSFLVLMLAGAIVSPAWSQGTGAAGKAAQPQGKTKADATKGAPADDDQQEGDEKKADDETPGEVPPDPSKTQRVGPVQIFKDPIAEEILDLKKFNPIRSQAATAQDVASVKLMAQNPNMPVDSTTIRRMVNGMVGQLTDTRNIQALIDPPPNQSSSSSVAQAIEQATSNLMEPLFVARANKSTRFLTEYSRVLLAALQPLLKHHLVPRVQAMMVLGETGSLEALKVFLDELKNPKQTVWVKLWALRGITNIKQLSTARPTAAQEIESAKAIATLLDENKDLPWPVQLRAVEALTALRQGFVPASPKTADMAATAMRVLADPKGRTEVRSEAARALGFMQITNAVSNYNFPLVAYAIGLLAADLGEQVVNSYEEAGTPRNEPRAQLMTSLLIGPIIQAFEGQPGVRESGLLHVNAGAPRTEVQKILDQVKPVAAAALELLRAPTGQRKARRADLVARVAALKEFLAKNPPADRHLVPGDEGFLQAADAQAGKAADAQDGQEKDDQAGVAGAGGGR